MRKYTKRRIAAIITGISMLAGVTATVNDSSVSEAAKKAKLGFTSVELKVGQKKHIVLKKKVKKASYTYKSSAVKRVSVSKKGVITAKSEGKAKITVKQVYKNKQTKIGTIKVKVINKAVNVSGTPAADVVQSAGAQTAQTPVQTVAASTPAATASPAAENTPTYTPAAEPTAEATPDVYTKEVLTIHTSDISDKKYTVKGATCTVDMQYFTGNADGDYFKGSIKRESSNVIKRYKEGYNDGKTISTARYILEGKDADNNNCTIFIEDNSIEYTDDSHVITKPTIITNNSNLSWLQTADIQGRLEDEGDGDKTIHIMWNESNEEKLPYPAVKMPDTSRNYNKEIFTFSIGIGASDNATGADGASASMINFTCKSDSNSKTFNGKGVDNFADTRMKFEGQVQTLSARYIMEGTDDEGNECSIYVENNGIDNGNMVTEPTIITDNPRWAWIETAPLHGTVSWSPDLTIHMWAAEE